MKKIILLIISEILPFIFIMLSAYFAKRFELEMENFMGYDIKMLVLQHVSAIFFGAAIGAVVLNKGDTKKSCVIICIVNLIIAVLSAIYILSAFFMEKPTALQFTYIEYMLNFGTVYIGVNIFNGIRNLVLMSKYSKKWNGSHIE